MKKCSNCKRDLVRNPKWSVTQWNKAKYCNRVCMGRGKLGVKFTPQARKNMSMAHKQGLSNEELAHRKKVRRIVQSALKNGSLIKQKFCDYFNEPTCIGRIEAHHHDYNEPLDVEWLCRSHHLKLHHQIWKE